MMTTVDPRTISRAPNTEAPVVVSLHRAPKNEQVTPSTPSEHPFRWPTLEGKPLDFVKESRWVCCGTSASCEKCSASIGRGEAHWVCTESGRCLCEACGPGVIISESFLRVDPTSHEREDLPILEDGELIHRRTRATSQTGETVASTVIQNVRKMITATEQERKDAFDKDWCAQGALLELLGVSETAEAAESLQALTSAVQKVVADESTLVDVSAPCTVFGDIHGQVHDLLLLFASFGMPGGKDSGSFVFNGDFVDRGTHQVEVIAILFALKVKYPGHVFLNRGNHEDAVMNARYGFEAACAERLGKSVAPLVYTKINETFNYLPLAALIGERILAVHGGLGNGLWTLEELRNVQRPLTHEQLEAPGNQWLWNLLWSDPVEEDAAERSLIFGVHASPRGGNSVQFGVDVTESFCNRNGVEVVVRSHQAKMSGSGFEVMHDERLMRVFSARDYEGHGNDAAVLYISPYDEDREDAPLLVHAYVLRSLTKKGALVEEPLTKVCK